MDPANDTADVPGQVQQGGDDHGAAVFNLAVIGASAGGVEALTRTVAGLPPAPAFAIAVLTHLDPTRESALVEVLRRHTALPVQWMRHGERIEHGCIYVLGPDLHACLLDRHLRLLPRPSGISLPIDAFLASAARDSEARIVAVVLSGTGSDAAAGAREVKAAGGYVVVQEPATARHDGMPQSTLEAAAVDAVVAPEAIGARIQAFFTADGGAQAQPQMPAVAEALDIIRARSGLDLRYYKDVNVRRRLLRRAFLQTQGDVGAYLQRLREDADEATALRDDLLIGVTAFFRDAEFVAAIERHVLPELLGRDGDTIRIWVPACSTGEEAYSIAMLAHAMLDEAGIARRVQVFGSDINERAIVQARTGRYPASAVAAIPEPLRSRCLTVDADGWRVKKHIREMCVFATHDLFSNAPFSNIDFLSCRNLLIYLRKEAKRHAFEVFFYALRKRAHLLLGSSEAADSEMFEDEEPALNLYRRRQISRPPVRGFSFPDSPHAVALAARAEPAATTLEQLADRLALARYAPPGFIVDAHGRVVHFRGDTSALLQPSTGDAALSLARLVRPELQVDIRTALMESVRDKVPVRRERVKFGERLCTLEIVPIPMTGNERYFLVSIQVGASAGAAPIAAVAPDARTEDLERYVRVLGEELEQTRSQLKAVVTEYDATSEELRTANEEVLSANEELQSANEELQNAKRELEQVNLELTALNQELQRRNTQLMALNDDLGNLIRGIPVPVLMIDRQYCVRHFSPAAAELFGLAPDSVGQPLCTDVFPVDVIESAIAEALHELRAVEREVRSDRGWFVLSARAYQTSENRIDGAVLAFQHVDHLKLALEAANAARADAERANAAKNEFLALVSHELRTPLNVISNWIALLRMLDTGRGGDARVAEALDTIDRNCRVQARLIDDLLDVSRITSGRLVLDLRPTDLAAVVRSIVEGMEPLARDKQIRLTTSGLGEPMIVSGDTRRLQQIVANLLSNALKFTPADGRVEVALGRVEGSAELVVSDNGIGIAAEQLPRVFERFSSGDIAKTREFGGMGLGLSIVRSLTEGHGGSVAAASEGPGRGARFAVRLPLAPAPLPLPAESASAASTAPAPSLSGLAVLLVDDEPAGRGALAKLLVALGAEVFAASGAADALRLSEERPFDALISDIAMPGIDGYRLIRELRAREAARGAPRLYAIALTGFASLGDRDEALAAGYDVHLGKPAGITEIAERLRAGSRRAAGRRS